MEGFSAGNLRAESISVENSPTPPKLETTDRKAEWVNPAMGAMRRGGEISSPRISRVFVAIIAQIS
jgi:hypothetical protein